MLNIYTCRFYKKNSSTHPKIVVGENEPLHSKSDSELRVLLESLVKCLGLFLVTFVTSMAMPLEADMDENSMPP